MTTMATVAVPADEWTLAYTASGTITVGLCNRGSHDLLVRIGTGVATSDAADTAADVLHPGEVRTYPLVNTDKVLLRPLQAGVGAGRATLRT